MHVRGQQPLPLVSVLPARTRRELVRRIVPGWYTDAACAGRADPDTFYPDETATVRRLMDATDTCAFCPVARSCLAVALVRDEQGVWGRTTEVDRGCIVAELLNGGDVDEVLDKAVLGPLADPITTDREWRRTA
jgi:hypothetical protein